MKKKYFLYALLLMGVYSFAQNVNVSIPAPWAICNPGDCASLNVVYPNLKESTSYQVNSIPYNPIFGSTAGNATSLTIDDRWSGVIDLKGSTPENFNFCFFGQTYNKVLISTNGAVTFSVAGETADGLYSPNSGSTWVLSSPLPYAGTNGTAPFRNSINGVFQDTNPGVFNSFANPNINYYTAGSYPNRVFIVNFAQLAQFGNPCSSDAAVGAQTSQIVLYETTNKIEVYVSRRVPCTTWSNGNGLVGIQNQEGTIGYAPPGRNGGTWSASNEAWRFTPDGNSITPSISWVKDGTPYGTGNPISICPTATAQYTATVSFPLCGTLQTFTKSIQWGVEPPIQAQEPNDIVICGSQSGAVSFDLTVNNAVILAGLNPNNYSLSYHTTQTNAQNGTNPITAPQSFLSVGNQIIYARVEDLYTACQIIKSFDLIISSNPLPPTGDANQTFVNGETLANIELNGTNIHWYGSAAGNDLLPNSTMLVDGVTYYASQTNSAGCESRTVPSRFAVTVHRVLSNQDFTEADFKVYPNPVINALNLSYSVEISSVEVYNMLGQKVLEKTLNATQGQIDMSNLNAGNYVVKVTADGLTKSIKVVKQ